MVISPLMVEGEDEVVKVWMEFWELFWMELLVLLWMKLVM